MSTRSAAALPARPSVARGDVVLVWSVHAQDTIVARGPTRHLTDLA